MFFMWVAEFKVWHENSPLLPISQNLDVHAFSTYLNSFEEKGVSKIMRMATFWGRDKEAAIQALYQSDRAEIIFREGDQLVFSQKSVGSFHAAVSDKSIFFLGPILEEKGFQWWRVGSNSKQNLIAFYKKVKKLKGYATIDLIGIKNRKLGTMPLSKFSDLNDKDLEWWKTGLREGYYHYPRKISLKNLSKKIGVPFSTLKDHLRKTENILMNKIGKEL